MLFLCAMFDVIFSKKLSLSAGEGTLSFCVGSRNLWKLCGCIESLPKPGAWRFHWLLEVTEEPCIPKPAVSMHNVPWHHGSLSCSYLCFFFKFIFITVRLLSFYFDVRALQITGATFTGSACAETIWFSARFLPVLRRVLQQWVQFNTSTVRLRDGKA